MMELNDALNMSYYRVIGELNPAHGVEIVEEIETGKIYVKKTLTVYNRSVYAYLKEHPVANIPEVKDFSEEDGRLTVIEEYVFGETLQERLERSGTFSKKETVRIILMLCRILAVLHEAKPSIIHRDIKPSNVLLTPDGEVYLLDMNAAKLCGGRKEQDTTLLGTVGYAAPEQYGFSESDIKTDIYAVGVLMNVLLEGVQPNVRISSGRIGKIIRKCTKMEPADRFNDVHQLMGALYQCGGENRSWRDAYRHPFAPPGFRKMKPLHMIMAVLGCGGWIVILAEMDFGLSPLHTACLKAGYMILFLLIVFFCCDYGGILSRLGFYQIRDKLLRAMAVAGASVLIYIGWCILMTVTEALLWGL